MIVWSPRDSPSLPSPVVPPRLRMSARCEPWTRRRRGRPAGRRCCHPCPPRVFDKPPAKDAERAKVGYRRVRISSKPDAVRSLELGRLDRGDEVEIVDSYEGFLQVRTPDGITGWIPRHTIVGAPTG